jgi:hypothetical protein
MWLMSAPGEDRGAVEVGHPHIEQCFVRALGHDGIAPGTPSASAPRSVDSGRWVIASTRPER